MKLEKIALTFLLAIVANLGLADELQLACIAKDAKGTEEQWSVWIDFERELVKFSSYQFDKEGRRCGAALEGTGWSKCLVVSMDDKEIIFKMELSAGLTHSKYVISKKTGRIKITNAVDTIKYDGVCRKIETNGF